MSLEERLHPSSCCQGNGAIALLHQQFQMQNCESRDTLKIGAKVELQIIYRLDLVSIFCSLTTPFKCFV